MSNNFEIKKIQTPLGLMRYSIGGQGPALLVTHGSGGGDDQGRLIADRFFPECRVIAVSRFGYLGSEMPRRPSNKKQAAIYKYILEAENISSAYVAGLSAGGPSSVEFAIEYPEACSGLILIAAMGAPTLNEGVKVHRLFTMIARSDVFYGLIAMFIRKHKQIHIPLSEKMLAQLDKEDEHFVRFMFTTAGSLKNRLRGMWHDRLLDKINVDQMKTIKTKTLLIHALDDDLIPVRDTHFTASVIPRADKLILPEGGHLLLTKHEKIKDKILTFMQP
ncbi:MAG: alpha/beta hydrolase [bacterium]|nr:alpha/beta hydrolase [bacterium]